MEWHDPWWPTESQSAEFLDTFRRQLELEVPPDHILYGLPIRLIARGEGDDTLFALLDGSNRVAMVHLTWAKQQERLPWPATTVFPSLQDWARDNMEPPV